MSPSGPTLDGDLALMSNESIVTHALGIVVLSRLLVLLHLLDPALGTPVTPREWLLLQIR